MRPQSRVWVAAVVVVLVIVIQSIRYYRKSWRPSREGEFLIRENNTAAYSKAQTCKSKSPLLGETTHAITTDTNPAFPMAVADYPNDLVSTWLADNGTWDAMVLAVMNHALEIGPCERDQAVVDVGANLGFFGLYAGLRGCKVYGFEMQPPLQACINMSLCMIDKEIDYTLITNPVSNVETEMYFSEEAFRLTGNKGGQSVDSFMNCIPDKNGNGCRLVKTVRVDEIVKHQEVRIAKVDVEGFEWPVIQSFGNMLSKAGSIQNLVFELTPRVKGLSDGVPLLKFLRNAGMTLFELPFVQSTNSLLWPEMELVEIPENIDKYVTRLILAKDFRGLGQADILATFEPEEFRVIPAQPRLNVN